MSQTKECFEDVVTFEVRGERQEFVHSKDVLVRVCEIMAQEHPKDFFHHALGLGRDRVWVSRDPSKFLRKKKIPGTDLYVDTNLNTKAIVRMSKKLFHSFNHSAGDLRIETRTRFK